MKTAPLSRRNLLALSAGLAAAATGSGAAFGGARSRGDMSGGMALAALCADLQCPGAISRACLRALPAEMSAAALARLITAEVAPAGPEPASAIASPIALRDAVRTCSRADFRNGRVLLVDGWLLSLTEIRVYALAGFAATAAS
ncbi:MAG TPA: hypothetical protein VME41_05110 [Stellaceae bacterium]|nr:hypothetical protein [Stellaceae bacterium]